MSKTLELSKTYIDVEDLDFFFFHGGEPHVKIPEYSGDLFIKANVTSWENFAPLLALLSAVAQQKKIETITLYMPYFPGARQDRSDSKSPLTVEMYATAIKGALRNTQAKVSVLTYDMHSQLGVDIVRDVFSDEEKIFSFYSFGVDSIDSSYFDKDIQYIVAPDKGAVHRASLFAAAFYPNAVLLKCEKKRDFETGKFMGFTFPQQDPSFKPGKMLVIDDICDGGGTFLLLSNALDNQWENGPAYELQLYVSHGIFSKTPEVLEDDYSKIYTTDSFPHPFYEIDFPKVIEIPVPNPFK